MNGLIRSVDELPFEIHSDVDGAICVGSTAVTEPQGWVTVIDRTSHRGSMRPLNVRVRVRVADVAGVLSLCVEDVDCQGRRFANLQAAVPTLGQAAAAMIPRLVFAKFVRYAAQQDDARESHEEYAWRADVARVA